MKPRIWKDTERNRWNVSYGPNRRITIYFYRWKNALRWANQYANRHSQEPTC